MSDTIKVILRESKYWIENRPDSDALATMFNLLKSNEHARIESEQIEQAYTLLDTIWNEITTIPLSDEEFDKRAQSVEQLKAALSELEFIQKSKKSLPASSESGQIQNQITQTVSLVSGMVDHLAERHVIGTVVQKRWQSVRDDITRNFSISIRHYRGIMQELQEATERVMFNLEIYTPQDQTMLTMLWSQLIYLYQQIATIKMVAESENAPPPPPPDIPADFTAPPPPIPPPPRASLQPPSEGGKVVDFQREIEMRKGQLNKARVVKRKQKSEWEEQIEKFGEAQNPEKAESEEDWDAPIPGLAPMTEKDLMPSADAPKKHQQVSLNSHLQPRISRKMEARLIGHPLFQQKDSTWYNHYV